MRKDASHEDVATTSYKQMKAAEPVCGFFLSLEGKSKNRFDCVCRSSRRTFSAVSRCQQRKLKMVTRQQADKHSHTRPTLPCDPINSFNGEWSVLVTRERRKRSVRLAARRLKKRKEKTQQLQLWIRRFRNLISALLLSHSSVSPRIISQISRAFYRSASVSVVTDAAGPD